MKATSNIVRIFVVEDDPVYARMIKYIATLNPEHEVHVFSSGKECLKNLHLRPTLISLDYSLEDYTGEELLKKIIAFDSNIAVIILSGQDNVSVAVQLLKNGAYDYIVKDDQTKNRLFIAIENIKKRINLELELAELKDQLSDKYSFERGKLIGKSPAMKPIITLIQKGIKSNISISITGETGTGKEIVAKTIHFNSNQKQGKFVAVNISAIPSDLLESELFGHEKGAFTGASTRKIGQFELADNGTLFLDEIGEMNFNLQAKLLRALQEREIQRVGGTELIPFDTRLIVATNKDLAEEVKLGNFREDLYYRLLGLPIKLPPLRERGKDIYILIHHFLDEYVQSNGLKRIAITEGAKEKLFQYSFPGNIRELKAIIELAAVVAEGNEIQAEDIFFNNPLGTEVIFEKDKSLKAYNLDIINLYLDKFNNDVRLVAKKLGIGKSTIYRLLKDEKQLTNKNLL